MALIAIALWFFVTKRQPLASPNVIQDITLFYPALSGFKINNNGSKSLKQNHNRLLISLILSLCLIALAQPVIKTEIIEDTKQQQATDLILVVNTSVSMVLRDYMQKNDAGDTIQLSRMDKTKQLLRDLVNQFKGQRIALVVLGRPASVWLPLTHDKNQIQHAIQRIQPTLGGRTNDIGGAMQLVLKSFNEESKYKKLVLLVNDGYLQIGSSSPVASVQQLVNNQFTVHSLAIGSPKLPEFSLGIAHLLYAPVDLQLMQSLADAGQGQMIHAWENDDVSELVKAISIPENATPNSTRYQISSLYMVPLGLAMCLFIVYVFPIKRLWASKS